MSKEKAIAEKKKRGRPTTGIGPAIGLRLHSDLDAAVDEWIEAQPPPRMSKPHAIRRLIASGLRHGGR